MSMIFRRQRSAESDRASRRRQLSWMIRCISLRLQPCLRARSRTGKQKLVYDPMLGRYDSVRRWPDQSGSQPGSIQRARRQAVPAAIYESDARRATDRARRSDRRSRAPILAIMDRSALRDVARYRYAWYQHDVGSYSHRRRGRRRLGDRRQLARGHGQRRRRAFHARTGSCLELGAASPNTPDTRAVNKAQHGRPAQAMPGPASSPIPNAILVFSSHGSAHPIIRWKRPGDDKWSNSIVALQEIPRDSFRVSNCVHHDCRTTIGRASASRDYSARG